MGSQERDLVKEAEYSTEGYSTGAKKATLDPRFRSAITFTKCKMPGESSVVVEVWDHDLIGPSLSAHKKQKTTLGLPPDLKMNVKLSVA